MFDTEQAIVSYDHLGIARLIYQLPTTLCEMFLKEVFKQGSIESLDAETLFTIQRFFENNLNVSETSRGLFVHRNTLVYRLEKIKKSRCGKACFRRSGAFLEYAVPAVQYRGRQARIPCAGRCFARTHSTVTPIGE